MIKDNSKKFKEDNFEKGKKKQGWTRVRYKKEDSPYNNWKERHGNYDPINIEDISDEETPWSRLDLSERQQNEFDALREIYPFLKRRQKEIINLLLQGQYNQIVIATMLGISPQQVNNVIKVIRTKIEKRIRLHG